MSDGPPFQRLYDLSDLGRAGAEIEIALTDKERAHLTQWLNVQAVEGFSAKVALRRHSPSRYSYAGSFEARIVQNCVVTLEPVRSLIQRETVRELYLSSAVRRSLPKDAVAPAVDDELTEEIETLDYDLAAPLLEELSLAIDPYPRAPGVEFEPPKDEKGEDEGPFAALKSLKRQT
jgi:hypothetical protein